MINQTLLNRYHITHKIGEGSASTVYKARDIKENKDVALKVLKEDIRTNEMSSIMRFSQQMRIFTTFRSPHIVNVFDVFQHQNFPVLVTEYVEGKSLLQHLNSHESIDIDQMASIMIDILRGMEFIHSKGIIHRDIKLSNILLQKEALKSKITDFGLALLVDLSHLEQEKYIAGTFSYMSPEQTGMLKKPLDFRSDMYSAGVLFYRLLTRQLPFVADDIPSLIHKHIAQTPEAPSRINKQISPVLDKIILKMLAKDPQDRYQTEKGIMHDLEEYLNQRKEKKELIDFEIAREDRSAQLTYQAHLIGREKELDSLKTLIDNLTISKGSFVCIAGKPGAGKTRLVNEVRTYAYTKNCMFVSGKCYKTPIKTPYGILKETLEDYILRIKRLPSNLKEEHVALMKKSLGQLGKELTKIAPGIEELIGEQPQLVDLEPQKERTRFIITVSNFLIGITTPQRPLLIFLDDLQWIDEASLEILQATVEKISDSNLIIITTYRDTEIDADHPLMKMMKKLEAEDITPNILYINDFDSEQTNLIISEILSEAPQTTKPLSDKIFAQTGGNPFFITELLHTLIDKSVIYFTENHYAYDLSKMESLALPDNVVDILISRIDALTAQTSHILSYSSVMGRKFLMEDLLSLLSFMDTQPTEIITSVEEAIDNQFLTRSFSTQEEIFFVHDRVREAFYKKLPNDERVELNNKIALSLEDRYLDNPDPVIFDLAHHFLEAGLENKSRKYSLLAAEKAQKQYAYQEAIAFYIHAKEIFEKQQRKDEEYIKLLENLGQLCRLTGKFDLSLENLNTCLGLVPETDKIKRLEIYAELGDALLEKGEGEKAIRIMEDGLKKTVNISIPSTNMGVGMGIMKEMFIQNLHVLFPKFFVAREIVDDPIKLAIAKAITQLTRVYYFVDITKMFYLFLRAWNLLERLGPYPVTVYMYASAAPVWLTLPDVKRTFNDPEKGIVLAKKMGYITMEGCAYCYLVFASYLFNKPKQALEYAKKGIQMLKDLGEYWILGVALAFRNHSDWILGKFAENEAHIEECMNIVKQTKTPQIMGWILFNKGYRASLIGEVDDKIIEDMKEGHRLMIETNDKPNVIYALTYLSFAYLRIKEYNQAIQTIEEGIKLFPTHYIRGVWNKLAFPMGAHIYLETIVNNPSLSKTDKNAYLKRAYGFIKQGLKAAKIYKIFMGYTLRVYASYLYLSGNKKKSRKMFEKSINWCRENEHVYHLGMSLFELGRFLINEPDQKSQNEAKNYLEQARTIFTEIGAKLDLKNTNSLLGLEVGEEEESTSTFMGTSTITLAERGRTLSLMEVSHLISSILDLDKLLDQIVELSIKASGAERGFLLLYNETTKMLELALSHPQKEQQQVIDFSQLRISKSIISAVEEKKEGVIYPPIKSETKVMEETESISFYGIRSIMCVPLVTKDKLLGMMYLDNHLAEGVFEQQDLNTLNSICSQAAISIENARLYLESQEKARLEQEINTAKQIQRSLLPQVSPSIEGAEVEGSMVSAKEVAGDYYDFIPYSPQKAGIVVADVSGKGLDAGMVMSMTKSTLYTLSQQRLPPKDLILNLNKVLYAQLQQQKFISLIYAEYDSTTNTFTWAGAGQENVIIYRASEQKLEVIKTGGVILGMFLDIDDKIEQKSITLNKGDKLILYSDGVIDAHNPEGERLGLPRFLDIVKSASPGFSAKELMEHLKSNIEKFIQRAPQYDDITLVVLGKKND